MKNRRNYTPTAGKPLKRVSAQFVSAKLNVSEQTITRWARRGYLPGTQEGRAWSFDPGAVKAFAETQKHLFAQQLSLFEGLQEALESEAHTNPDEGKSE
ncbi:MAG: helix-turn-helix domain-containing protein [Bdellovibrionales bacterium]|nr:helix-turn-helix domain-containing protein [Bdellovibrionales bacterium]